MANLLRKLKDLLNASVRGPRRYKTQPTPPAATADELHPPPEVTEAPAQQDELPEVTEAPVEKIETPAQPTTPPVPRPATQIEETDKDQSDTLEEGRVADLLKGEKS